MFLDNLDIATFQGVAGILIDHNQVALAFALIRHFDESKEKTFKDKMIVALFNKAVRKEKFEVCLRIFERYEPTMITNAR